MQVSENEISDAMADGMGGACLNCEERVREVEPDARNYKCEFCGEMEVYGLEELLMMGEIILTGEDMGGGVE